MNTVLLVVVLSVLWAAVTGAFTVLNLLLGAVIAIGAVTVLRGFFRPTHTASRLVKIGALAVLFGRELVVSAVRVAVVVLSPRLGRDVRPAFVAFPLTVKSDAEIALLAQLITLTPGTLSVDVSSDRKILFVHVLEFRDKDALVRSLAEGFEARVREVFA